MTKESQSYQTMFSEVEDIVKKINNADLELDQMVTEVERGYELIQQMKTRLSSTKLRIEELQQKYDDSQGNQEN